MRWQAFETISSGIPFFLAVKNEQKRPLLYMRFAPLNRVKRLSAKAQETSEDSSARGRRTAGVAVNAKARFPHDSRAIPTAPFVDLTVTQPIDNPLLNAIRFGTRPQASASRRRQNGQSPGGLPRSVVSATIDRAARSRG